MFEDSGCQFEFSEKKICNLGPIYLGETILDFSY